MEMDDTIRETLRGITAGNPSALEEQEKPEPEAKPEPVAEEKLEVKEETKTEEKPGRTANRQRDEKGRLLPGKREETPAPVQETAPEALQNAPEQEAEPAPQRLPRWRKGVVERFTGLDPELQSEILKREDDFHRGIEQYREKAAFGSQVEKVIAPYLPMIQAEGGTPDRAIASLLQTAALFRTGTPEAKANAVMQLCHQFNIALPNQVQADPNVQGQVPDHWASQFQALQARIQSFEQQQALRERQMQESTLKDVTNQIEQFASVHDKDGWMDDFIVSPDGSKSPGPFRQFMANVIENGQAKSLAEAYEIAKWAHPEARKVELARQQASAEEARRKAQAVEEAKRASSVNVRSRGSLPATEPTGSMEDTIRETLRRSRGG